ncbi:MAG: hypothetical protein GY774_36775, partial [Planctomycetes bacterium]|nr:hypothetical protein [Planctomycetota bacterium]
GKRVTLNGVNYTFLQRGKEDSYNLDNYVLDLSSDFSEMKGHNVDEGGKVPDIVYKKIAGAVTGNG